MRATLTDRLAQRMDPTPGKIERYFDTDKRSPRGFLLRITPAGARVWALQYRVKDTGRQREATIGDVRSWPLNEARRRGHELRRIVDQGGDPLEEREEKRAAPTVAELWARFEREELASRARSTQGEYTTMARDWILPAIGRLKLAAVSREDVERLHRKVTAEGYTRRANAVKSLVSILFTQAINWKLAADNPAVGIKNNVEPLRERYLTAEETARLMVEVARYREKGRRWIDSCDKIELALLTGARPGEILSMRWSQLQGLDAEVATWTMESEATKEGKRTGRSKRLPLAADAVAILRRRQDERAASNIVRLKADDGVFRLGNSKAGIDRLKADWWIIRAAAGLDDVRFHDLRHNFASVLVSEGLSLEIIGKLLGHSRPATIARYAHLRDRPLREAAEKVATVVRGRPR